MSLQGTVPSLSDPPGSSVLAGAAQWIEQAMLGTVATTVAVIAVAAVGFMMLTGRINYRRGVTAIIGCFILFGAAGIAARIRGMSGESVVAAEPVAMAPQVPPQLIQAPPAQPQAYDPYAGASVPSR